MNEGDEEYGWKRGREHEGGRVSWRKVGGSRKGEKEGESEEGEVKTGRIKETEKECV